MVKHRRGKHRLESKKSNNAFNRYAPPNLASGSRGQTSNINTSLPPIPESAETPSSNQASYRLWFDTLSRNFDLAVYRDFHRNVLEDLYTRRDTYGFDLLLEYYENAVYGPAHIDDEVLVDLADFDKNKQYSISARVTQMLEMAYKNRAMEQTNFIRLRRFRIKAKKRNYRFKHGL
jgi:hypothetical protein